MKLSTLNLFRGIIGNTDGKESVHQEDRTYMQKRWKCSNGAHAGILAPARLRKIDVRRYCLPCSEEAGVLVERTCPSKEKERARKKENQRKKQMRRKQTQAQKKVADRQARARKQYEREHVAGIHVPSHFQKVCESPVVAEALECLERKRPIVKVRRRRSSSHTSGHAAPWTGRVVLTLPVSCTWGQLAVIVAHEIAHICCADEEWHGAAWKSMFLAILEEAYGLETTWPVKNGKPATIGAAHSSFETMMDKGLGNKPPTFP